MDKVVLKTGVIQIPVDIERDGAIVQQRDASGNLVQMTLQAPLEWFDKDGKRLGFKDAFDRAVDDLLTAYCKMGDRVAEESPAVPLDEPPRD